jgi:hypothetical protein
MEQLAAKGGKGKVRGPSAKTVRAKSNGFGYKKKLHHGAHLIKKPKVAFEKKDPTHTQMLSQQYLEFGQKARSWCVHVSVCVCTAVCVRLSVCVPVRVCLRDLACVLALTR